MDEAFRSARSHNDQHFDRKSARDFLTNEGERLYPLRGLPQWSVFEPEPLSGSKIHCDMSRIYLHIRQANELIVDEEGTSYISRRRRGGIYYW